MWVWFTCTCANMKKQLALGVRLTLRHRVHGRWRAGCTVSCSAGDGVVGALVQIWMLVRRGT